ncbi:hypothetical protein CH63R_08940 [Colletotrichum higginsianum IMI 349063]|uniref:Uncharacterized protein n=1 Tax=Colletotrichum higginsianum (strain IMI 349063) TaxID=759273 RepID=A0A1B7Y5U1_COLHI|nr:hypothetical protein CH63R_08940 [Colletotrichum higginsianum IMI 349063]OBR07419.1 hypothetical protein CH63R_08940 [Colletotrichum higginsianum IMI 349063]
MSKTGPSVIGDGWIIPVDIVGLATGLGLKTVGDYGVFGFNFGSPYRSENMARDEDGFLGLQPCEAILQKHIKALLGICPRAGQPGITNRSANLARPLDMVVATVTMMQALSHISSHPTLFSREQLTTTGPATPRGCWNGRLHSSRHAAPPV